MKRINNLLFPLALCILPIGLASCLTAAALHNSYTAAQAKDHIGEKGTVCGVVASTHYAAQSKGSPTFVNLDEPYPHQLFTILIWGKDLPKFGDGPAPWKGKRLCVTGTITSYRGTAEIVANSPDQITKLKVKPDSSNAAERED
jgi:hypothetical protein